MCQKSGQFGIKLRKTKNGNFKNFEKTSTEHPRYDPRERLEKIITFQEAILNVSKVEAFLQKIVKNKKE